MQEKDDNREEAMIYIQTLGMHITTHIMNILTYFHFSMNLTIDLHIL